MSPIIFTCTVAVWYGNMLLYNIWNFFCKTVLHCTTIDTHPFNGPLCGTTQVSQYQKGKTNLDFTEARDSEWQWHQLGHM